MTPRFCSTTLPALAFACAFPACFDSAPPPTFDNDPPLADAEILLADAPDASGIPRSFKSDGLQPLFHDALRATMSPVKSQAKRGVCSIFSTIGLMEHLYIAEGTVADPDFSEQYLQWSAKFEVGSFPSSSGSNAYYNLQAIKTFGVVEEYVWPYETTQWDVEDDPSCTGEDDQPTFCYTNGHPSESVTLAHKYYLPSNQWLHPLDIKSHIQTTGTAVVVGFDFFYQAWNHKKSTLPTTMENWAQGVVLYPNEEDIEVSLEKRAGHSILIIGWDDDMEVPMRGATGAEMVDENGEPVMERGFYLFKNSWGTSSFGIDNPYGAGYGWISQEYLHDYGRARVAGLPTDIELPAEVCDDGIDNDHNSLTDCEDPVCEAVAACATTGELSFTGSGGDIPDNQEVGFHSLLEVDAEGQAKTVLLDLDVKHPYRGDLVVTLRKGDVEVVVLHREGSSQDDIQGSFELTDFAGLPLSGTWELMVQDLAGLDVGSVLSWSLTIPDN